MKTRFRSLLMVMALLVGFAFAMPRSAAAHPMGAGNLPTTKTPTSARFTMSGSITTSGSTMGTMSANTTLKISGSGAMSGDKTQLDMNIDLPQELVTPGEPNSLGMSFIMLDQQIYFKLTGISPESNDKWYVTDASTTSMSAGSVVPGMTGSTALPPGFEDIYTVKQVGKEVLNGAATTKYQIDVDLKKLSDLSNSMNGTTGDTSTAATISGTMMMFMWVGDADQYLHQFSLAMDSTTTSAGSEPVKVGIDLTMTFKDFDTKIDIVAPPNAEPLDMGSTSSSSLGTLFSSVGMPLGVPLGMPAGLMSGSPAGMPTTGSGNSADPLPFAAITAVLLIAAGATTKRFSLSR